MKILFIYSNKDCASTRKCVFELMPHLKKVCNASAIHFYDVTDEGYNSSDAVILQRFGANGIEITKRFINNLKKWKKNKNVSLFYMLDDFLRSEQSDYFINQADACITFADIYKQIIPEHIPMYQMRTFVDVQSLFFTNKSNLVDKSKFNILCASTGGLGKNIFQELQKRLKQKDDIELISIHNLNYSSYLKVVKSVQLVINPFEVGDHPLATQDFLNAKSCIKYVESGAMMKPMISSPSVPYEEVIVNHQNGYIAYNIDQWVDYILRLKNSAILYNSISKNAYSTVLHKHDVSVAVKQLISIINEHKNNN